MDIYNIKNAIILGFFLSFMIGPVFFMLIQTSVLKGARAAIMFNVGVILGDVSFIIIAYLGSRHLLERIKDDPRLFFIGGLILIIYGLITYFDKSNKKEVENTPIIEIPVSNNYLKLLFKGFFLNFINIGVLGFWLGLIVVIGPILDMNPNHIFWYFTTIIISYFITDLGKIFLAKKLKKRLTANVIYKIKKSMGILLIIFGVGLMLKGFIPKEKLNLDTFIEKVEK
ncbi:Threonine efflux protein [Polaribacter huanghezhanensis]|uniref:LysE family translocator n=1 Tax=Polaribacter huanghezhanensis TaxID=1354726 RepID=UPI0026495B6A|nr:LysE family transporter [Polaribacter huanghezhanensis]WKD85447.1 Threonine efflux protein [Polaribacter huanghezhanensis]